MGFYLAVWHTYDTPTPEEASSLYLMRAREKIKTKWHPSIEAFYGDLCRRYPELDDLEEDDVDQSPWSCAHDRSDGYLVMCLNDGNHLPQAAKFVFELAARHGLICFDPQGPTLSVPPGLRQRRSRIRFW